jgi:hypothetical protein
MPDNEIRIPAAVLGAAVAALLGAMVAWLALRRRADDRWLQTLISRSGSDERRRGLVPPRWSATDADAGDAPVDNQAIEPAPGHRVSVIR